MPASLLSLKIRGVRSYSPLEHKAQSIDFMPLTLIVGSNGNGKTTLIESLKFVISGEEPPHSDSRRNFLHTSKDQTDAPKLSKKSSYASIELEFQNAKDQTCFARREIFQPASTAKNATPSISSGYRVGKGQWNHVHKQDDWSRTIPLLFNLPSQAMLNNVILCHQEENLWAMGESTSVKLIFDKIFGCENYKKEIKNIESELRQCKQDLQIATKELSFQKEKTERKKLLISDEYRMTSEIEDIDKLIEELTEKITIGINKREEVHKEVKELEMKAIEINTLKNRKRELDTKEESLRRLLKQPFIEPETLSNEELEKRSDEQLALVEQIKSKQSKLDERGSILRRVKSKYELKKASLQQEINSIKVTELKSKDTYENLCRLLKKVSSEQVISGVSVENLEASFRALEEFDKELRQNKCDKSELEDKLSNEQQNLMKSISKLESACSDLLHKIKSREKFIEKLTNQLAQSDPIAKDLVLVAENLGKMSVITNRLPISDDVGLLKTIMEDSSTIIDKLVIKIQKDGIVQLKNDILKESKDIETFKENLDNFEKLKKEQIYEQSRVEKEHSDIRVASKEAHNKMISFSHARQQLMCSYKIYRDEKKLLAGKHLESKVEEANLNDRQLAEANEEFNSLNADISKLCDESRKSFELVQEYKTNIGIRQHMKELGELAEKLETLKKEVVDGDQYKMMRMKLRDIETEVLGLRDQRSRCNGSMNALKNTLEKIRSEIKTVSNVNSKYAEVLGKVVCNKIIINDLEKLKLCFEQSITAFHNQMIVKINEALRARWRQIYKGSDIRYIELVDEEIKRGDKKGYNYYVAMYKGNVKMKMREKSSAGQKALASIILRMTLAELFVKDFAFIALDEPTSNLDLDNVLSLAKAIGSYVKRRATRGTNIQWIIITHDEQFLRALDAECSPYYYKIQLDSEGCSKIIKISYQDAKLSTQETSSSRTIVSPS